MKHVTFASGNRDAFVFWLALLFAASTAITASADDFDVPEGCCAPLYPQFAAACNIWNDVTLVGADRYTRCIEYQDMVNGQSVFGCSWFAPGSDACSKSSNEPADPAGNSSSSSPNSNSNPPTGPAVVPTQTVPAKIRPSVPASAVALPSRKSL